jgi:MFS transporter, DHA2 family, multidrug resistance protein
VSTQNGSRGEPSQPSQQTLPAPRTHSKEWLPVPEGHPMRWRILSVLVVSLLVVVLDNTVLNIALPTIQQDLNASQSQLVWAVDAYVLVFAALLFTWGVLGDKYGRRRILIIGLSIFGIASAFCAFATSADMLIAFRAVMGVGGAAVLPVTLAIITVVFPPHERGRAIGLWAAAVGAAVALGPVLGGLLLQNPQWFYWLLHNNWGSVFLINVPIVAVGLVGIVRFVPETRNPRPQRLDLAGLFISVVGLVLLVFGIIRASETLSWTAASVIIPIVLGVLIIAGFVVYEARSDHRSFDVSLFKNRGYAVSLTAVSLAFFAMSGVLFSLPFYLQTVRGLMTLEAGLCFLPFAVGQFLAAPRSAKIVARFGYRAVMTSGLLIVGVVQLGLTALQISTPLWSILVLFFFFGIGMGLVIAPASTVMQNVLPLARVGAGSAVQNTVRQVFGAFGIAIVGTLLATRYASEAAPSLDKLATPAARQFASQSVQLTKVALEKAQAKGAPPALIAEIRHGAYEAFLTASHMTTLISAIVMLIAAAIVGFWLPAIRPPQAGDAPVSATPSAAPSADAVKESGLQAEAATEAAAKTGAEAEKAESGAEAEAEAEAEAVEQV